MRAHQAVLPRGDAWIGTNHASHCLTASAGRHRPDGMKAEGDGPPPGPIDASDLRFQQAHPTGRLDGLGSRADAELAVDRDGL